MQIIFSVWQQSYNQIKKAAFQDYFNCIHYFIKLLDAEDIIARPSLFKLGMVAALFKKKNSSRKIDLVEKRKKLSFQSNQPILHLPSCDI